MYDTTERTVEDQEKSEGQNRRDSPDSFWKELRDLRVEQTFELKVLNGRLASR